MIELIQRLFAPKVGLHGIFRGFITMEMGMTLQAIIRSTGLNGWMRVVKGSYVLLELEGSRPKMDALIEQLQHTTLSNQPTQLELTWRPSKNEFQGFHVAF